MRIGISEIFNGDRGRDRAFTRDAAQLLEGLGFDGIWLPEHIVFFNEYTSQYPYGTAGQTEVERLRGVMDQFILASAIAMVTERVRIGTYVCILPERNPVVTAREIASIDVLSGGRFDFCVGIGWSEQEYEAVGVPWARRGRRCDDYLRAMKALWEETPNEETSYSGEFVSFEPLLAYPKPVQKPHPPIIVSGNSEATIRRIVELGDGWAGYNLTVPEIEDFLTRLDKALTAAGRKLSDVTTRIGRRASARTAEAFAEDRKYLDACAALGLTEVVVSPRFETDKYEQQAKLFAEVVGLPYAR